MRHTGKTESKAMHLLQVSERWLENCWYGKHQAPRRRLLRRIPRILAIGIVVIAVGAVVLIEQSSGPGSVQPERTHIRIM
jgi:hypothetical protein